MRSLITVQTAHSMCMDALENKPLSAYTVHDYDLRIQRSVLEKIEKQYADYVANSEAVRNWCEEYERKSDRVSCITAATWRWLLGDEMRLPIKMVKSR